MGSSKSYIINNEQIELLIPNYPKVSNLTIINTMYTGKRRNENDEIEKDFISILFRDNDKGTKSVYTIYEPQYTFYKLKEGYNPPSYNLLFIDKEKVDPYTCKYSDLLRAIAEVTGNDKFYFDNVQNGNSSENKKLHIICSDIFMSDMNIENYYRFLFGLSYTNNAFTITKGFMDIETDTAYCDGQFPESGMVPINAIAYCDEAHDTVYQFIYNDKRNPLVEQYKQSFNTRDVLGELHNFVINAVGGMKKAKKFKVDKMKYKIVFFDDELELIRKMFQVVNSTIPDFIEFWNMAFDFNFIIDRIVQLGADPIDIICDPRIKQQVLKFYVDERNKNNYEERTDFASVSSYIVWIDQMIQFASRRKGRGAYPSFKLDAIGESVAGVNKLDYSHITTDIGQLPYLDMKTFSFYNVMDVIVQKCIETVTQDAEYVFTKCLINNTIYAKCHRQSVYLANRFTKDFFDYGYVIGNNRNLYNEKPITKFPGAMVGDPLHNETAIMIHVNGMPTLICDNDVDWDYSALYPSIILENNLAPNTQIGRIIIEDKDNPSRRFSLNEHQGMYSSSDDEDSANYSRGGEFVENLMSNSPLEFGRRWMGLGDVYQVIDDIKELYTYNRYTGIPIDFDPRDGLYFTKSNYIEGIIFNDKNYAPKSSIIFYGKLEDKKKEYLKVKIKEGAIL